MEKIIKDFYSKYIEFENFIEFRIFDLKIKLKNGKNPMYSMYAKNIEEVQVILDRYNKDNYIVYVGCNSRKIKGKKDKDVEFRRTIFFDVEAKDKKPPLINKKYYTKLLITALYIWKALIKKGIIPNLLMESGRGLHIGIKLKPLKFEKNDAFSYWYKNLVKELMKNRPYEDIKFDDSMINPSRIESAPGFSHNKYPEKPKRKILKLFLHQNDLNKILNDNSLTKMVLKKKSYEKFKIKAKKRKKYTDKSFYESPEWLLLSENDDLPEGDIHNKLLLIIKIMARDNDIDLRVLQEKISELGYNEVIDTPTNDYQYSEWVLYNWCMQNAKYCLEKKIKFPSPFKDKIRLMRVLNNPPEEVKKYPVETIDSFKDLLKYIRKFNYEFSYLEGKKIFVYHNILWEKIEKGVKDKYLIKYIEFLGIKLYLSADYITLKNQENLIRL